MVVSDTHLPARAKDLPAPVWAAVEAADVVVHAGDWCDAATVLALRERSGRLVGVAGNNDGADVRAHLDEFATFTLDGVRFGVVHETGDKAGRERRCDSAYAQDLDVLLFGHSHIPWDTTTPRGLRLLNPGSPTDRRRQPTGTWMEFTVRDGTLSPVELHRVPPRPVSRGRAARQR
ncbi:YfcE family phosphodiesterase [Kineococcus aurantiacus]